MLVNTITQSFKELITNRYLTVLSIVTIVLALGLITYILLSVRASELQLVTHYTAFGVTHLYRSQWYYLYTFAGFALIVALLHVALSIKIYITKGHPLAIAFAWMGIGILLFAWITAFSIINVWSPI
jgi:hypothetical protein